MSVAITYELEDGSIAAVEFDATVRETHESTKEISDHAVEEGTDISDHARDALDSIALDIFVSDSPITVPKTNMSGVQGRQQRLQLDKSIGGQSATVLQFSGDVNRSRNVYEELIRLKTENIVVGVLTGLRNYNNMLIRRVSPIREAATGSALQATVELRQIRIVTSEVVPDPTVLQARNNVNHDQGTRNPTPDANQTDNRSMAAQLWDAGESFFGSNASEAGL